MIRNSRKQTGSAHIVIVVILVSVLLGLLGFVFWQNFIAPSARNAEQSTVNQQETKSEIESESDLNEGYFVLDDWSIKFKIPEGLTGIKYYKVGDSYELTTSRVEDLGGDCRELAVDEVPGAMRLGGISRSSEPTNSEYVLKLNHSEPINGYYYWYGPAQAPCGYNDPEGLQAIDRGLLLNMVDGIEAK
jgi:hypothetical protein